MISKAVFVFGIALAANAATLNFNPDWKFIKADPAGAAGLGFDDRSWSSVSLPHTFNDVDTFDDWSTPGHVGEMNLWSGRVWYRKTFTPPQSMRGRRVFLEFEAVRQVAEVYINGHLLGVSKTGFLPFGFDLTPYLRIGAKNVIAVMADNRFTQETEMARIIRTEIPWNSPHWHPAHGGIYRNVYLHVTDPLHIALPLYSFLQTAGPYAYASEIAGASARINVEVPVRNERAAAVSAEIVATVLDRNGRVVLEMKQPGSIPAGGSVEIKLSGVLPHPQLWEPAYPYLYRVLCAVRAAGRVADSQEIPLGIRAAHWDVKSGLTLNGRRVKLHGWGQKPTDEWPGLGAAQPDWMHFYTLRLMKDAGGNFVRWGHCAGAPAMLAASDRLGIITEQPGVDGEGDAVGDAWTIRAAAFRDMLIYFRNHPSILIWEGGNQKVTREHAKELRGYMDRYDPHGGRVYAHRRADEITAEFMDIGIGTEGGREIARLPVVEGEYNREESPRRVWDNFSPPSFGYPEAKGQTYQLTSEQYAVNQVGQFVKKLGAPNHAGGANWIFSDSTSGGRVSTEVARAGGEVDGVRLPKEAYYVCRAMFRDDPQVHIIGHWTYPANTKKPIYVASNAEDVELFLNRRSLGHGKVSDRYLFTFPETAFEPGELKAVAYRAGQPVATHELRTASAPVALRMTQIAGPKGLQADGSDVVLLDVEAVDAKGVRCPTFQQRVDFSLEGPGVWRGGYNSGKIQSTNNQYLDLEAGVNRVAIRAARTAGAIVVRATAEGLKPASFTARSIAFPAPAGFSESLPALPAVELPASRPSHTADTATARTAAAAGALGASRLVTAFSYSGPGGGVHIENGAATGKRPYIDDDDARFDALPSLLNGHEYVQTSNADRAYSAVDLIEIAVQPNTTVSVAHDDRLPRPEWLTRQFQPSGAAVTIKGKPMQVFQRRVPRAESLTLGSNVPEGSKAAGNMYVVLIGPGSAE